MENELNGNIRSHNSKGDNHRLREKGIIPGVIYGLRNPSLLVEFSEMELHHILSEVGDHGTLRVKVGNRENNVIIKEIQRDPVTNRINHIDLQRVENSTKVRTKVPIVLKGENYFRNSGTIIQQQVKKLDVEGVPSKLPRYIVADVTNLTGRNRVMVSDLEVSEEISILNNPNSVVVSLANTKLATNEETQSEEEIVNE